MPVRVKEVTVYICERCEHEWVPRIQPKRKGKPTEADLPTVCPKCKSPYWNRKRQGG